MTCVNIKDVGMFHMRIYFKIFLSFNDIYTKWVHVVFHKGANKYENKTIYIFIKSKMFIRGSN